MSPDQLRSLRKQCQDLIDTEEIGAWELVEKAAKEHNTHLIYLRHYGTHKGTAFVSEVTNLDGEACAIVNHIDDNFCFALLCGPNGAITENS